MIRGRPPDDGHHRPTLANHSECRNKHPIIKIIIMFLHFDFFCKGMPCQSTKQRYVRSNIKDVGSL